MLRWSRPCREKLKTEDRVLHFLPETHRTPPNDPSLCCPPQIPSHLGLYPLRHLCSPRSCPAPFWSQLFFIRPFLLNTVYVFTRSICLLTSAHALTEQFSTFSQLNRLNCSSFEVQNEDNRYWAKFIILALTIQLCPSVSKIFRQILWALTHLVRSHDIAWACRWGHLWGLTKNRYSSIPSLHKTIWAELWHKKGEPYTILQEIPNL